MQKPKSENDDGGNAHSATARVHGRRPAAAGLPRAGSESDAFRTRGGGADGAGLGGSYGGGRTELTQKLGALRLNGTVKALVHEVCR